ncbi:MAG: LysM peptidoglycan-binding domain-containing protein [Syntrophales bacterium]
MSRESRFLLSFIFICFLLCQMFPINNAYGQMKTGDEPSLSVIGPEESKDKITKEASPSLKHVPPSNGAANEQEREKGRDIMEEALELLDESREYWVKGDLENALDLLDQAYALLLDTDGEPEIARQKDDIRLLISKQILAIYSSMHTTTSGKHSEIPHIVNSDVEKEIRLFQTVERDFFIQSHERSALYRPIILKELKKAGLPEELSWLPLVESGFKIHALSRARALGLWQFIPSTGYKYGLNRDEWIDERLDVEKSTRAAIDYLKELHGMFGDWLTVLAAYNCGEGRVLKVISRQHINYFDRFWDLYRQLPYETARYVPRFLATLQIIKNPKKYDFDLNEGLERQNAYRYETVKTDKSMRLQDIARHLGTPEETIATLNSELRQNVTPDKEYNLKVPPGMAEKSAKIMDEIPKYEKPRQVFVHYRAKRGETVVSIARKYRTSVSAIMAYNNVSSRKRLETGQRLIIPVQGTGYARARSAQQSDKDDIQVSGETIKYRAKKGDTLVSVAKRFDTTVDDIRRLNKFKKRKTLKGGQVILISNKNGEKQQSKVSDKETHKKLAKRNKEAASNDGTKTYTVRNGDSLGKIAKKNRISLDKILEMNKLAREDNIHPGQVIILK